MKTMPSGDAAAQLATHVPAADTAAVVTLAAASGTRHVIDWISWSYEKDNAAAETLTLSIGGSVVATWYIPVGAATANPPQRHMRFKPGILAGDNEAVVVTLSACADTTKGAVNVGYR